MATKNRKKQFGKFVRKDRTVEKIADDEHVKRYVVKKLADYPGRNSLLIELLVRDYQQFNNKVLDAESLRDSVTEAVNGVESNEND